MPGVPLSGGLPTLSELKSSSFSHLGQAADWWDQIANKTESTFQEVAQQVRRPGGVEWEGAAGDAAAERADADLFKVRGRAWAWQDAAAIARRGQDQLEAGQRSALDAVNDAERDGFQVGDDYRVTDTRRSTSSEQLAERQGEAEAHSSYIRHRVAALVANDQHIANELRTATADFGNLNFQESPVAADDAIVGDSNKHIEAVDRTWKQGPDQPGTGPYDPNPRYPGRNNLGQYGSGNTGSADGAAAAERALQDYEQRYHTTLIRQQIRVSAIDPQTGQPIYRYYDALEPVPDHPGEYIGIEVKSGTASLSPNQRIFDAQVSPQNPATGTLNGQPVKITDTNVLRAPQFIPAPPAGGEPGAASGAPPVKPPPVEPAPVAPPPAAAPPVKLEPLPPPVIIGSGGGEAGGGGGGGIPGLGIGGVHVPTEEVD